MSIKSKTEQILTDNTARFFMPGHKGKLSFYDITEIPGADNLNCPEDEILKAQQSIAKIYGSDSAFISVNGSSGGILAAILSVCSSGSVLIDRGCHISAVNAMILGDCTPVYLYPEYDEFFGISCGITKEQVQKALVDNSDIKAVVVTSPTYYGVVSDIKSICEVAHKKNIPVIVDGAHGAHFAFSPLLPQCAIKCGADIVIHSTHKTLNCLTQGAIVHKCGNLVNERRLKQALNTVQTTSPSYILMSSVEQSVYDAQTADFESLVKKCDEIRCIAQQKCVKDGFFDYDKTKIVINGNDLDKLFAVENIAVEMYDGYNAVLMPSPYNSEADFKRLYEFLKNHNTPDAPCVIHIPKAEICMTPREAFFAEEILVDKKDAVGKIASKAIYKMPPCIPVVCPGERITKENIKLISDEKIWCVV